VSSPYLSAADLAHIYRVTTSTIYKWASEDKWRRTRYRPVRYHMDDAQASWAKRHPGDWQRYAAKPNE
jgi:uncharacterized protein YjcR